MIDSLLTFVRCLYKPIQVWQVTPLKWEDTPVHDWRTPLRDKQWGSQR